MKGGEVESAIPHEICCRVVGHAPLYTQY